MKFLNGPRSRASRVKYSSKVFVLLIIVVLINIGLAEFEYVNKTWDFEQVNITEYKHGRLVEFTDKEEFCHSWAILPGISLYNYWLLAILYGAILFYLFWGIAIISHKFMESIEAITSQTIKKKYIDKQGNERKAEVHIWNPTIANLTLMALGSSSPEILLNLIETIMTLGQPAGELGPSAIVGTAAFNILIISAVSLISVPSPQLKKIDNLGVFAVTMTSSFWAYIWIFICLKVWTPDEITIWEALITFSCFFILAISAYIPDKIRERMMKKEGVTVLDRSKFSLQNFYHILHASEVSGESDSRPTKSTRHPHHEELIEYLKSAFHAEDINDIQPEQVEKAIRRKSIIHDRIAYKRHNIGVRKSSSLLITQGLQIQKEEEEEQEEDKNEELNTEFGFRSFHYSASQA